MKILICTFIGIIFPTLHGYAQQNLKEFDEIWLSLRNGGYSFLDVSFNRFSVKGNVTINEDRLMFTPDSVLNKGEQKVFRYNDLIKSFELERDQMEEVKYSMFFANFLPARSATFKMKSGIKYRFVGKKAKELVRESIDR